MAGFDDPRNLQLLVEGEFTPAKISDVRNVKLVFKDEVGFDPGEVDPFCARIGRASLINRPFP